MEMQFFFKSDLITFRLAVGFLSFMVLSANSRLERFYYSRSLYSDALINLQSRKLFVVLRHSCFVGSS